MKKRLFSLLLILCMVLGMLPMNAFATGNTAPVKKNDISISMRLNTWEELDLSEYFTDADNNTLTYYVSDDGVVWNKYLLQNTVIILQEPEFRLHTLKQRTRQVKVNL